MRRYPENQPFSTTENPYTAADIHTSNIAAGDAEKLTGFTTKSIEKHTKFVQNHQTKEVPMTTIQQLEGLSHEALLMLMDAILQQNPEIEEAVMESFREIADMECMGNQGCEDLQLKQTEEPVTEVAEEEEENTVTFIWQLGLGRVQR